MTLLARQPAQAAAECCCMVKTLPDGRLFIWQTNPACTIHGYACIDWRAFLEMSGRMHPNPPTKMDCGDVVGRFGVIS